MDAENKIQLDELGSKRRRTMKLTYSLSLSVQYEYTSMYEMEGQKFYGQIIHL